VDSSGTCCVHLAGSTLRHQAPEREGALAKKKKKQENKEKEKEKKKKERLSDFSISSPPEEQCR